MNEPHGADEIDSDELQDEEAPKEGGTAGAAGRQNITLMFVKEVTILLVGVFIGFFWSQYFNAAESSDEVHIIVSLLIVILCLVRYIYLFVRR